MRAINAILVLCLILPLSACVPLRPERQPIAVAGDAEVRIVPDRVIIAAEEQRPRTVTATGDAEVRVAPDEVILTLGVETSDKDLDAAKQANDATVKRVLEVAQRLGIEEKHVQTDHISIEPRYHDSYEQSEFIGYFVRKSVVVTLKDLDRFEDLLSGALEAGANYVHGVEFRTTELRKHRDEARALAIRAAREKAQALAGELGQEIGEPLMIQEDYSRWYSWYGSWWGSRWGSAPSQNVVQNSSGGTFIGDGTTAPGQISVQARVTVQFALQ